MSTSSASENLLMLDTWGARLRSFACRCMAGSIDDEIRLVREGAMLLNAGGAQVLDTRSVDVDALDEMLACGATESAVLTMMPEAAVFMLSRGQGDACLATLISPSGGEEVICEGPTVALALLTAYFSGLLLPLERSSETQHAAANQPMFRLH